eukprot:m.25292 g.25292  ORF g.25292 m.25292 type:complete len:501 (+) comp7692_c0_seq1:263-1765(+)
MKKISIYSLSSLVLGICFLTHESNAIIEEHEFLSFYRNEGDVAKHNIVGLLGDEAFGVEEGGIIDYYLDCNSTNVGLVSLWVLTPGQSQELSRDANDMGCEEVTRDESIENAGAVTIIDTGQAHVEKGGPTLRSQLNVGEGDGEIRSGFYYFILRECMRFTDLYDCCPAKCKVVLNVTNKGGEHLSSDEIMIPQIIRSFISLWSAVIGLWVLNWAFHFRKTNRLHDMIVLAPLCHLIALFCDYDSKIEFSREGSSNQTLDSLAALFRMMASSLFFLVVMLTAHGWCILRYKVEEGSRLATFLLPPMFFVSSVATKWLHRYFLALAIISAIVMVIHILKESGSQLYDLRTRLLDIIVVLTRNGDAVPEDMDSIVLPLVSKRFLISIIRGAFVGYALFWAFFGIMAVYLTEHGDVKYTLNELLPFLTWLLIMWAFRAQSRGREVGNNATNNNENNSNSNNDEGTFECHLIEVPGHGTEFIGVPVTNDVFSLLVDSIKSELSR